MEKEQCSKCKHTWIPRVENPKECPKCKRRDWKLIKKQKEIF